MNKVNNLGASVGKAMPAPPQEKFFQQFIQLPPALQGGAWQIIGLEQSGISPRDYFAAQALAVSSSMYGPDSAKEIAQWCYRVADAMLEARKPFNNSQFHEDHMTPHKGQSKP